MAPRRSTASALAPTRGGTTGGHHPRIFSRGGDGGRQAIATIRADAAPTRPRGLAATRSGRVPHFATRAPLVPARVGPSTTVERARASPTDTSASCALQPRRRGSIGGGWTRRRWMRGGARSRWLYTLCDCGGSTALSFTRHSTLGAPGGRLLPYRLDPRVITSGRTRRTASPSPTRPR